MTPKRGIRPLGSSTDWKDLINRVADALLREGKPNVAKAARVMAELCFNVPEGARVTKRKLAIAALLASKGKTATIEEACQKVGISDRSFRRYFLGGDGHDAPDGMTAEEFQKEFRRVWHQIFWLGVNRFGLKQRGYIVCIDAHQAIFYGAAKLTRRQRAKMTPEEIEEFERNLTEVAFPVSGTKNGEFRAHQYEVMVAYFPSSGVVLPMEIFLTATDGEMLNEEVRVPGLDKFPIMKRHIDVLENLYPVPNAILFDRGYDEEDSFAYVSAYCKRYATYYMTPARKSGGLYTKDAEGIVPGPLNAWIEARRPSAKPIYPGSKTKYLTAERPMETQLGTHRTVIAFIRQRRKRGEELPESALQFEDGTWAFSFYTNARNVENHIAIWERIYSKRWNEEALFRKRATQFRNGVAHRLVRRMFIFMLGFLQLAMYALARALRFPKWDVTLVSKKFPLSRFLNQLVDGLLADPPD